MDRNTSFNPFLFHLNTTPPCCQWLTEGAVRATRPGRHFEENGTLPKGAANKNYKTQFTVVDQKKLKFTVND